MCQVKLELITPTRISGTACVAADGKMSDYGNAGEGASLTLIWPSDKDEAFVADCQDDMCSEANPLHVITAYFLKGKLTQFDFSMECNDRFLASDCYRCQKAFESASSYKDQFGEEIVLLCSLVEKLFTCLENKKDKLISKLEYGKFIRVPALEKALDSAISK